MNSFINDWDNLQLEIESFGSKWQLPTLTPVSLDINTQRLNAEQLKTEWANLPLDKAEGWLLAPDQLYILPTQLPEDVLILQAEFCLGNQHWQITHLDQSLWLFNAFQCVETTHDKATHISESISQLAEQIAHRQAAGFTLPEKLNYNKLWRIGSTESSLDSPEDCDLPTMPRVELALFTGFTPEVAPKAIQAKDKESDDA